MPVYWFALSFVESIDIPRAVLVFIILHLLVYPASNGYNSYMDRDEDSIGGLQTPLQPTKQLFYASIILDALALVLSFFISLTFTICVLLYITCSRLYSYRGVRLKRYPILGYLTVVLNQGALTFFMVYHGVHENLDTHMPFLILMAAAFLIGGFYPITQLYQHKQDAKDGVTTISMLLGKRGTFIFCSVMYTIALLMIWLYFNAHEQNLLFIVLILFFLPVVVYFVRWFLEVTKNESLADFKHTMRMNWLASTCTSLAFITIILLHKFWLK